MRPLRRRILAALAPDRTAAPSPLAAVAEDVEGRCALLAAAAHLRHGDRDLPVSPRVDLETRMWFAAWLEECAHWRSGGDR